MVEHLFKKKKLLVYTILNSNKITCKLFTDFLKYNTVLEVEHRKIRYNSYWNKDFDFYNIFLNNFHLTNLNTNLSNIFRGFLVPQLAI